jgi:hypothetical protein
VSLDFDVLHCGNCEELKLGVHAGALALAALCGAYNAAAWLVRRERHLAVNTMMYAALVMWEQKHVARHMEAIRHSRDGNSLAGLGAAPPESLAA